MGEISMIAEIKEKWPLILETIKNEHEVSDVSFKTWLLPLEPYDTHDDVLFILPLFLYASILSTYCLF